MRIPVDKPLPSKSRTARHVKRGYDVFINSDGNPAKASDPFGVWKRIVGRIRDADLGISSLTLVDLETLAVTTLKGVNDKDTLFSRRVDGDPNEIILKVKERMKETEKE